MRTVTKIDSVSKIAPNNRGNKGQYILALSFKSKIGDKIALNKAQNKRQDKFAVCGGSGSTCLGNCAALQGKERVQLPSPH